jgi:hypothetical protein
VISQEERERVHTFFRVSKNTHTHTHTHTQSSKGIDAIWEPQKESDAILDVYKLLISRNPLISRFPKPINLQIIQNPLINLQFQYPLISKFTH